MQIISENLYHVYNQGNFKQTVFNDREDYLFFLRYYRKFVALHCETLAYCLMPNHFHFLIYANEKSAEKVKVGGLEVSAFANGMRLMMSKYAQTINLRFARKGSLFRQRTKAKNLTERSDPAGQTVVGSEYAFTCFQYIHQNPYKAGLVQKIEDWEFSSFRDYAGLRKGTLCNQVRCNQFIDFDKDNFIQQSYSVVNEAVLKKIFA